MTVLQPGELLTAIRIPGTWAGAQFYIEKVADRKVWDFPLRQRRLGDEELGGRTSSRCASRSTRWRRRRMRLEAVERFVAGKPRNEETAEAAGELAVTGAVPLTHNAYKIPLMRNLVKRAIRGGDIGWASTS